MKVLVAYDGTLQAKEALRHGMDTVRQSGGELTALHVFNGNLFIDYDALPWSMDVAKTESARQVEDALELVANMGGGAKVRFVLQEGDPEEEIIKFAIESSADILFCPPHYIGILNRYKKILHENGRQFFEDSIMDTSDRLQTAVLSMPFGKCSAC